jgi:hypothetical protein
MICDIKYLLNLLYFGLEFSEFPMTQNVILVLNTKKKLTSKFYFYT